MLSHWQERAYAKWLGWTPEMIDFGQVAMECLEDVGKAWAYSYIMTRYRAFGISREQAEDVWRVVSSAPLADA